MLAVLDPIAGLAGVDVDQLSELLAGLQPADEALSELLDLLATDAALQSLGKAHADPNELPAAVPSISQTGDLWILGEQRLLCGDATDANDVHRLFADEHPNWMWTDPPYGVDYTGKTSTALTIANDRPEGLRTLLDAAFGLSDQVLESRSPVFVAHPAGEQSLAFGQAFVGVGWHLHQTLVWVKDAFVLGHSNYHYRHESILYGWKGARPAWLGGRNVDTVFEIPRPRQSEGHPTVKPVELVERHLLANTRPGRLGYDPFSGAGTTLLAAERTNRRCRATEILPSYVDLAVERWQQVTGARRDWMVTGAHSMRSRRRAVAGRKTKLTPEVHTQIVQYIGAGAYAHVAARAAGVSKSTYYHWLQLGEKASRGVYYQFRLDVQQAHFRARAGAEIEVRQKKPMEWLRIGPGRTQHHEPGWTEEWVHGTKSTKVAQRIVDRISDEFDLDPALVEKLGDASSAMAMLILEARGEPL